MKPGESNKALFALEYLVAVAGAAYLFAFGWTSRRHRGFIQSIARYVGFAPRDVPPELPIRSLPEVLPETFTQQIVEQSFATGNVSPLELCVLNELVREHAPAAVLELGTFDGRTTLNLAANTPPETKIWTLDLPAADVQKTRFALATGDRSYVVKDRSGARFENRPESAKIVQLHGDTATFDFSPWFGKIDFVFIDASHGYDYVLNDSRIALKLLRNGKGVIVWHDYGGWPGVTAALNHLRREPDFRDVVHIEGTTLALRIR
jgi:predicted O-methyltransferase YrrM